MLKLFKYISDLGGRAISPDVANIPQEYESFKTVFEKDETYIRLEKALAEQDYNRLVTAAKYDANYERLNTSVNSNLDKFNSIADKYKDFKL